MTSTHGKKKFHDEVAKKETNAIKDFNTSDHQKWLSTMVLLFPEESRPVGDEDEPFTARVYPIIDQMKNLRTLPSSQPSVLFSILTGPAWDAYEKMNLQNISIK